MSGAEGLGEAGSDISPIGMTLSLPKGVGVEMLLLGNVGGKCFLPKGTWTWGFVSGAGCLAFLMSKYVLFKETNKQSKTPIHLDFIHLL